MVFPHQIIAGASDMGWEVKVVVLSAGELDLTPGLVHR